MRRCNLRGARCTSAYLRVFHILNNLFSGLKTCLIIVPKGNNIVLYDLIMYLYDANETVQNVIKPSTNISININV